VRPELHRNASIQMLVNRNRAAGERISPAYLFNLKDAVVYHHRIVLVHGSLVLDREDQIQISAPCLHKRIAFALWLDGKAPVELIDVLLAQEGIGCFPGLQAANA